MIDPDLTIRPWRQSDNEEVWRLIDAVWHEFGDAEPASATPDLADIATAYGGSFWVAVAGSTIVGTAALKPLDGTSFTLKRMYVLTAYRGRAVARHLLEAAIDAVHRAGGDTLYLGTVEEAVASHRFYEKHGFVRIAEAGLPAKFFRSPEDTRFYRLTLDAATARPYDRAGDDSR